MSRPLYTYDGSKNSMVEHEAGEYLDATEEDILAQPCVVEALAKLRAERDLAADDVTRLLRLQAEYRVEFATHEANHTATLAMLTALRTEIGVMEASCIAAVAEAREKALGDAEKRCAEDRDRRRAELPKLRSMGQSAQAEMVRQCALTLDDAVGHIRAVATGRA